ncbi:hypothetical protein ACG1BZ_14095 [Microbulbifer sp. CNSA002]|uniref:hypothetical protein n=1 Tax=Microbulbifer sp. CNSA002 TaxID=3373604 RepID=UPI0039B58EE5
MAQRYLNGDALDPCELTALKNVALIWRERLTDISWFMRCLNKSAARQANTEDKFKLGQGALAAYMAYIDLNSIKMLH